MHLSHVAEACLVSKNRNKKNEGVRAITVNLAHLVICQGAALAKNMPGLDCLT